jgi:molybdopterin molybdotransferase
MLDLETARARILAALPPPSAERVPLAAAGGRIAAEGVVAAVDLPVFDNSSMDGYAVRAADTAGASPEKPLRLRLVGRVGAGEVFPGELQNGQCIRIFTGSPLPRGADAVVMQEDTRPEQTNPDTVLFLDGVKPWENVRLQGEDLKRGATLIEPGTALAAGHLSLLSASGVESVSVGRRPVIGLLATGSELREPGQPLGPGQIYESNRVALAALVRQTGLEAETFPLVPDTLEATRLAIERVLSRCDVVVTSGGVSVGEMDFVKAAFAKNGGTLDLWQVAIRPGKPFVFGHVGPKFLFGLPGNPVSAFVTFLVLVRPALLRWQGAADIDLPSHPGVLVEPLNNPGPRRHFIRVKVSPGGEVSSAGTQASHTLSSLAQADGLVDVPPKTTLPAATRVVVLRMNG